MFATSTLLHSYFHNTAELDLIPIVSILEKNYVITLAAFRLDGFVEV